ncbi:MAG TPA: helix-turn-helix domain-containing protein [Candidatus Sumerlaeota bacterium]|nr:helix-turn-helix domain-containing protein [Candidatus Sumerlaeota bacterium]
MPKEAIAMPDSRRAGRPAAEAGREYWRVDRVARYLDISRKRVYQLVQEGHLRKIRIGARQMRIDRQSLEAYIARKAADAAAEAP